jgi:uncharacterized protein YeaO (DUF488 family)
MIRIKRVHDPSSRSGGKRILIDRLWPRGLTKNDARLDSWRRDLSPSSELRTWFGHDPARYPRFRILYRAELLRQREALLALAREAEHGPVTLVYAAKDPEHNNAVVLQELLEGLQSLRSSASRRR